MENDTVQVDDVLMAMAQCVVEKQPVLFEPIIALQDKKRKFKIGGKPPREVFYRDTLTFMTKLSPPVQAKVCSCKYYCNGEIATIICHSCSIYNPENTAYYCKACFDSRHPWFRVQHIHTTIENDESIDMALKRQHNNAEAKRFELEGQDMLRRLQKEKPRLDFVADDEKVDNNVRVYGRKVTALEERINALRSSLQNDIKHGHEKRRGSYYKPFSTGSGSASPSNVSRRILDTAAAAAVTSLDLKDGRPETPSSPSSEAPPQRERVSLKFSDSFIAHPQPQDQLFPEQQRCEVEQQQTAQNLRSNDIGTNGHNQSQSLLTSKSLGILGNQREVEAFPVRENPLPFEQQVSGTGASGAGSDSVPLMSSPNRRWGTSCRSELENGNVGGKGVVDERGYSQGNGGSHGDAYVQRTLRPLLATRRSEESLLHRTFSGVSIPSVTHSENIDGESSTVASGAPLVVTSSNTGGAAGAAARGREKESRGTGNHSPAGAHLRESGAARVVLEGNAAADSARHAAPTPNSSMQSRAHLDQHPSLYTANSGAFFEFDDFSSRGGSGSGSPADRSPRALRLNGSEASHPNLPPVNDGDDADGSHSLVRDDQSSVHTFRTDSITGLGSAAGATAISEVAPTATYRSQGGDLRNSASDKSDTAAVVQMNINAETFDYSERDADGDSTIFGGIRATSEFGSASEELFDDSRKYSTRSGSRRPDDSSSRFDSSRIDESSRAVYSRMDDSSRFDSSRIDESSRAVDSRMDDSSRFDSSRIDESSRAVYSRMDDSSRFDSSRIDESSRAVYSRMDDSSRFDSSRIDESSRAVYSRMDDSSRFDSSRIDESSRAVYSRMDDSSRFDSSRIDESSRAVYSRIDDSSRFDSSRIDESSRAVESRMDDSSRFDSSRIDESSSQASEAVKRSMTRGYHQPPTSSPGIDNASPSITTQPQLRREEVASVTIQKMYKGRLARRVVSKLVAVRMLRVFSPSAGRGAL